MDKSMDATILKGESVDMLMQKLKKDLAAFPEGMNTLDVELESSAKHLPAYLKIVKSHIDQLSNVLNMDTHNHKTLETAGLAEPVIQLIKLFRNLEAKDLQLLEELSLAARNWQSDVTTAATSTAASKLPLVSAVAE